MDDEDIHDRLERLEATVADQQQTIEQLTEPPAVGRRGVLASLLGAGAVGGLAGYGSQSARAQASGPAGQVGTGEEPVDVEAWNLTVQNEADGVGGVENPLTETLDADGNDVTGVGALEAEKAVADNIVLSQSQMSDITYHTGRRVAIDSTTSQTIFDLTDPVDVVSGSIQGPRTRDVDVTFEDGTKIRILREEINEGEDGAGDEINPVVIPPIEGVTKMEFSNWDTQERVYGWEVLTV